jgi:hypothetical protein
VYSYFTDSQLVDDLNHLMADQQDRPSRATAVLSISRLHPAAAAAAVAAAQPSRGPGGAVLLDAAVVTQAAAKQPSLAAGRGGSSSSSSSSIGRPASPARFLGSHEHRDGSSTFTFEEEAEEAASSGAAASPLEQTAAAAAAAAVEGAAQQQQQSKQQPSLLGQAASSSLSEQEQQEQQQYGVPGQPDQIALLCFEDVIQSGVSAAVHQLQDGSWQSSSSSWGRKWLTLGVGGSTPAAKDVVMLTGQRQLKAALPACWCMVSLMQPAGGGAQIGFS